MENTSFNSVMLDIDKCMGCTTCIKKCPTEAIRVRNGKAKILKERCIDCGQCISVCKHRAKITVCDSLDMLKNYKYRVAMPAPSLYGQFNNLPDVTYVLAGLLRIGFDDVYEVAAAAEMISDYTRSKLNSRQEIQKPAISSACPACIRLIKKRFPELLDNVLCTIAPVELAAISAREAAVKKTGLMPEEIGVFFISPCPAKMTEARYPLSFEKPVIDGVFSMAEIYVRLLGVMKKEEEPDISASSGLMGIGWCVSGGESAALLSDRFLAVDGIDNVIKILEDLEDDKINDVDFIEVNACNQGCVGGCLTVENPYVAKSRIKKLMRFLPVSRNKAASAGSDMTVFERDEKLDYTPMWGVGDDVASSLSKMKEIEKLEKALPGLDCGSCGTPTCRSFAEDVVLGFATEEDCIFKMREKLMYVSGVGDGDEYLPLPFRKKSEKHKK